MGISDEQHTVAGFQLCEEVAHLLGAGETGFIDHVQVTVGVRLASADEEALQGVGGDSEADGR
jgi:hypothetical protein